MYAFACLPDGRLIIQYTLAVKIKGGGMGMVKFGLFDLGILIGLSLFIALVFLLIGYALGRNSANLPLQTLVTPTTEEVEIEEKDPFQEALEEEEEVERRESTIKP